MANSVILASQFVQKESYPKPKEVTNCFELKKDQQINEASASSSAMVVDEVIDILRHRLDIYMTRRKRRSVFLTKTISNNEKIILESKVQFELSEFVRHIASLYNDQNGYHTFNHAAHVVRSMNSLISILRTQEQYEKVDKGKKKSRGIKKLYKKVKRKNLCCTYGIGRSPRIQFALVFAALIHDVGHTGVPNCQLMNEEHDLCNLYDDSVAEMHSIDVAISLLKEKMFSNLLEAIAPTSAAKKTFQELVIKLVLSTDIASSIQKKVGMKRWQKAFPTIDYDDGSIRSLNVFGGGQNMKSKQKQAVCPVAREKIIQRKASAVLDLMMQAADVAHTMQEWEIFIRWNRNLYIECIEAHCSGRIKDGAEHPLISWNKSQIAFLNAYIIPLAKKIDHCRAFGEKGNKFLQNAKENCRRWLNEGEEICEELAQIGFESSEIVPVTKSHI